MLHTRTRLLLALLPALVTCLVIGLALASARSLRTGTRWVDHTGEVLSTTDAVLARALDAETGQRGYLVTGDSGFLGPKEGAEADVARSLTSLRSLTADNASQRPRIDSLERVLTTRFALLDSGIVIRDRANAPPGAILLPMLREGRARMDQARTIIRAIKDDEVQLLAERRTTVAARLRSNTWLLVAGGVVAVALSLLVNAHFSRMIADQQRMMRELGAQLGDLAAAQRELAEASRRQTP